VLGAAAIIVGALTAYQSRVNGELSVATGNGVQAAAVSFGSGWLILTVMLIFAARYREGLRRVITAVREGRMPWWQITGGIFGGFFVGVQSVTVPLIGVAVFTVAVVAGQSGSSLLVDRAGFGPAGRQPISPARVVSAVLAVLAVAIAVSNRIEALSIAELWPILIAIAAGLLIAFQQAINGRVGAVAHQPISAAFINFTLGFALLGAVLGVAWALTDVDPGPLPAGPWWIYTGGAVGVAFIATAAWVVQRLGVLLFVLLSVTGQLLGALVLDVVAPTPGTSVQATLVIGVAVAGIAVAVGSLPQWWTRPRSAR
jgi:transporter family-2 protein